MKFTHDYANRVKELEVVYIEYQDGVPHQVTCSDNGYCDHFDFYKSCYDDENLMYYHSGGGGSIRDLQAPTYVDGYNGASYWMHESASFSDKYKPKNITRLKNPLPLRNNIIDPFNEELSHEVYGTIDYCKFCDKYYDENGCDDHHVWDEENGVLKYIDGTEVE
ncbi:hypothetical protein [Sphingobacterium sp. JUb56]|uniref:hypothetical protein n=1 Tax=Sphingobacterium sp. JUb56 TaxID=2587145 RepID=UPI0016128ECF|nr:hypothetical protein [Sphingobacterium sp. JUb56]MBB2951941.1 hypothetical protein [Sphingobacterium sp. JUb56]